MVDPLSFPDFDAAARGVISFLSDRLGFDLWLVSRIDGVTYTILQANDHSYGIQEGYVCPWEDTLCYQMITGNAPRVAPDSQSIPAYNQLFIKYDVKIGAYIGVPLSYSDGSLFGTLCAIHPTIQPEHITKELPLIELLARLLSSFLNAELKANEQIRCTERAQAEAMSDILTGLYNRRGWEELLASEETRCRQYGYPACIIMIDLDGLKQINDTYGHSKGDQLIYQASQALKQATRRQDIVARLGGDEFAVLGIECNILEGEKLAHRIKESFQARGISASIGIAERDPSLGLTQAWEEADRAMYACKKSHREKPCLSVPTT